MKNDRRKMRRGIGIIVVMTLLIGTLFPAFGNTAQASEIENVVTDGSITTTTLDQNNSQGQTAAVDSEIKGGWPSISLDNHDNVHVTFEELRSIYYIKLDDEGNTLVEEVKVFG